MHDERRISKSKGIEFHAASDRRAGCFTSATYILIFNRIQFPEGTENDAVQLTARGWAAERRGLQLGRRLHRRRRAGNRERRPRPRTRRRRGCS